MTTDTTDNVTPPATISPPPLPPRRREGSWWPWLVSLSMNAAIVAVLFFFGHSVFEFDRRAEQERTEEVRLRELARQELERQQRARVQLTSEQAELLQKRERRQTRDELRVHIEKMREHRREMQRLREEAFDKLRRRPQEEMVRQELEPLRREMEQLRAALEQAVEKIEDPQAKQRQQVYTDKAKNLEDLLEDTVKNPEKYNERREHIQKEARDLKFAAHDAVKKALHRHDWDRRHEEVQAVGKGQREGDDVHSAARRLRDSIDEEEMNNVDATATQVADLPEAAQPGSEVSDPAELYEAGREVENQVKQMHNDVKAAALAASSNSSFGEAKQAVEEGGSDLSRPDLASVIAGGTPAAAQQGAGQQGDSGEEGDAGGDQARASAASSGGQGSPPGSSGQQHGEDTPRNPNASSTTSASAAGASGGGGPTLGDVRAQREAMDRARREIGQMQANTASMVAQAQGGSGGVGSVSNLAQSAMMRRAASTGGFADMTGLSMGGMGGGGDSDDATTGTDHDYDSTSEGIGMVGGKGGAKLVIPEKMAKANALPGRVFTDDSARRGWLFLDTWWVIGPWDNRAQVNWDNTHPPRVRDQLRRRIHGKVWPGGVGVRPVRPDRPFASPPRPRREHLLRLHRDLFGPRPRRARRRRRR